MNPSADVFYQPLGCDINTAGVYNCRPRNAADYATENGVIEWGGNGPFARLPSSVEGEWERIVPLEQITEPVYDIGAGRFPWQRYQRASTLYSYFPDVSNQTRQWLQSVYAQMGGISGAISPDDFAADVAAQHMAQYGEHYTLASNVELTRYTILDRLLNQPAVVAYRGGRFEVLTLPEVQASIQNGSGQAAQREQAAADSYDFLAEFGPWFMALVPIGAALVTAIGAGIGVGATAATEVSSVASSGAEIGAGAGAFESAGAIGSGTDGVQLFALPAEEPILTFALPADVAMTTPVSQLEFLGTIGGSPSPFVDVSSAVAELPADFGGVWPSATSEIAQAVQDFTRAIQSPGGADSITTRTSTYQAPSAVSESASVSTGGSASTGAPSAGASLPGWQSVIGGASATLGVAQMIRNLLGPSPLTDRAGSPATGPAAFTTPRTTPAPTNSGLLDTLSNPWIMAGIGGALFLALKSRKAKS